MNVALKRTLFPVLSAATSVRGFHASPVLLKLKAGRYKRSKQQNKPITYDEAFKPERIMHQKGWVSFNTSNLHGEEDAHQMLYEDMLIRRFISGTFYRLTTSEVVIKRRLNILELIFFVKAEAKVATLHFLATYSEEFLAHLLGYNVKIHLFVTTEEDTVYKYV